MKQMSDRKCVECKINEPSRDELALCKECLAKYDYSDISIGLGMGLDLHDIEDDDE